ncbi:D-alanine--D-alanine ligase family protein [Marinigracilibium pacificum]|uniref:D-alanine--D-alanine ligase n=1 Tax=Marinigracilibium pacificum TaxID=2729599 RepID=A0A848J1T2_9BACT|nr:D-alanine--D-alanine ligase family protein [Marinigracilibium pacificum]NMM49298.1 D-alanine--D-alanine ligase [Marinigracilibium pacificum]
MQKKKVALLYGGKSVEHDISIRSAKNIFEAASKEKYDLYCIGIDKKGGWFLTEGIISEMSTGEELSLSLEFGKMIFKTENGKALNFDVAFPALHGTDGEDGNIQGLLEVAGIPYAGSDVMGSSIAMNKYYTKQVLEKQGIPVCKYLYFDYTHQPDFDQIEKNLGLPFIVKPINLGSSVGVSKVKSKEDFQKALDEAFKYDNEIIIEEFVTSRELECSVLVDGDQIKASVPGEIVVDKNYEFYTFEAKYVDGNAAKLEIPAKVPTHIEEAIKDLSINAFKAVGCQGFARVDVFYLEDRGICYINEINTIPGFTNSSMFPMMWKHDGYSFEGLIDTILDEAIYRFERKTRLKTNFNSGLE